jgi:hypothetical protein
MDSVISRVAAVAAGRFAPGHVGELTRIVPFEMVDAALAETNTVQKRLRVLPSRVVVYLLLAAGLFAELGYGQVWARMTAGLDGLAVPSPAPSALAAARRRIGWRRCGRCLICCAARRPVWPRAGCTGAGG